MENFILLSRISLNTDILETNVINISFLIAVLFNVVGGALKQSMRERKENILDKIQDAEQRLKEASERLLETKIQLDQSELIISKIKADKELTIQNIALTNKNRALEEVKRQANSTKLSIASKEQQFLREAKEEVSTMALANAFKFVQNNLKVRVQVDLLNQAMKAIGGQKWNENPNL